MTRPCASIAVLFVAAVLPLPTLSAAERWAHWRGPLATGASPDAKPPVEWSETKNVRWKTPLPGRGHSSPIVWGDRIFVTAAIPYGDEFPPRYSGRPGAHDNVPVEQRHEFVVIAIDRKTGKIVWKRTVHKALPREGGHRSASLASASPVTDGELVWAFFGSFGLYCLDFDGEIRWQKNLGELHSKHGHGEGAGPVLHGATLAINQDHEEQSFVVAFNKRTGDERWRKLRDEVTSWSTPIVVEHGGKEQLIVPGSRRVRAYDLATGDVIWECGGLSENIVASPVYGDGIVYIGSSYEIRALLAIRLDGAKGDVTGGANVLWTRRRSTPYVPSPLLYRGQLHFLGHYQGVLTRLEGESGKDAPGTLRLPGIGDVYASPVAADGRVYVTDRNGRTIVLSAERTPRVLAVNSLDDRINASAALVGKEMFLRGEKALYCLAAP